MSQLERTLKGYVGRSKSRRERGREALDSFISSPVNQTAPPVVSSSGGSTSSSPVGNFKDNGDWGNPDSPNFVKQYLTTVTAMNGRKYQVHKNSAAAFQGFINELGKMGYRPKSIGTYNNRNIAGTNVKSQHAWANAIDFDPQINRGDRLGGGGSTYGNLPKNIAQIAAKYGLTWGGLWKNRDPMHFEFKRKK